MKIKWLLAVLTLSLLVEGVDAEPSASVKPNIIFILADDLGYGDVGAFYQNSRPPSKPRLLTPQLDSMAQQGIMLRQHYSSAPVCAPARASLLLGQHQGNCAIRDNQFDKALPNNHTLATVLKQAGYYCGAIGKWGLAGQSGFPSVYSPQSIVGHPLQHGFDEFFGYVDHSSGHVYYHDAAHPLYQDYTNVTDSYADIYSTDLFFARAKKFISERATNNITQPFFLFLAPTAVHAMLQVPGGPFPSGAGIHGGLQWPLTPTPTTADTWIHPDYTNATTSFQNAVITSTNWSATMKRYATMGRRLDDGVGDVLQLLRDLSIASNTIVVFTSDNGPANEGDGGAYASDPRYFDSWANMDGIKRDLWEAGIREPVIAWWPGTIAANTASDTVSAFWDWLPTFAELSGQVPPAQADGVSLVPTLTGNGSQRSRGFLYFEYNYNGSFPVDGGTSGIFTRKNIAGRGQLQSLRLGDFTAVRYSVGSGTDPFRLYNVVADPHQDHDLAGNSTNAALLGTVQNLIKQVRHPESSAARPYDAELVPAANVGGVTNGIITALVYKGEWPWVPDFGALAPVATNQLAGLLIPATGTDTNLGLSYQGYLRVPTDGSYMFYLADDSGAQFWLHEVHLMDDDFNHTGAEISRSILLKAGLHPFRIFYRHGIGATNLSLKYSGPGLIKQAVPLAAFYSDCPTCASSFIAQDDYLTLPENISTNIDVLANDAGASAVISLSQPKAGTTVIASGKILYTPATNFLGNDSFTYLASDGFTTSTATVHVKVTYSDGTLWFPFNEVAGRNTDTAGGDYTGILTGFTNDPAQWVAGKFNYALKFNGISDQVVVNGYKGILGASNRTIAAWINTTNTGAIVSWGPKVTGQKWVLRVQADNGTAGAIRLEVEGGYVVGTKVVTDGQWHHVAAVFNNSSANVTNVQLYVDGQLDAFSARQSQGINTQAGSDVQIGTDIQGRFFKGIIDELHLYNRALNSGEIINLYNATNQAAAAWHYRYFGTAPTDWNASDGVGSRLLEYAVGAQPKTTSVAQLWLSSKMIDHQLQLSFPRRIAGTSDLQYSLQISENLIDWSDLTANSIERVPIDELSAFELAIYQIDLSSPRQLFVRLKVYLT